MLRQEMSLGYFEFIHRPGEKLGVLDNESDYDECRTRVHCNCTHGSIAPAVKWDEGQGQYVLDDSEVAEKKRRFHDRFLGMRHTIMGAGEHNNVYFPGFIHYKRNLPDSLMQDVDGHWLELHDIDILGGEGIPMPGIDDPHLLRIYARQLAQQAKELRSCHYVAAYVMGAEMLYPEYFGLGYGDYRPASWAHFEAWCHMRGKAVPQKTETLKQGTEAWHRWIFFREQAMADRCRIYYKAILDHDDTHLAYYPTHGSAFHGQSRSRLGQQPDSLACSCDGMEMGHILVDDDAERRNVIMISHFTSFGSPVIVPRLGNKTADLSAMGGGRSFTPQTLRRLVYECVGLGISIIFPIHWRSRLHDGEWYIKDTTAETECRRVFDELTQAAPFLNGMGRLQPQVGLFAADETWRSAWQPRWTGILQDALCSHISMTVVTDALLGPPLARKMPVLLCVDDEAVSEDSLRRLLTYLDAGGKAVIWGRFALRGAQALREAVLRHPNVAVEDCAADPQTRVVREMFLAGVSLGTDGTRYTFKGVRFHELARAMREHAPEAVLSPFEVKSEQDASALNVYALTDRAALIAVCVNNAPQPIRFSLAPDTRLLSGAYRVVDAATGAEAAFPVQLEGNASRMLFFGPDAARPEMERAVCEAEDAFEGWRKQGARLGALRHYYSNMRSGPHMLRRYALARALLSSLALKVDYTSGAEGLEVRCAVLDAQGGRVAGASVYLRTTPGDFEPIRLTEEGGRYVCRIPHGALPKLYDATHARYEPLMGAIRLVVQAEKEGAQGGCLVTAYIS